MVGAASPRGGAASDAGRLPGGFGASLVFALAPRRRFGRDDITRGHRTSHEVRGTRFVEGCRRQLWLLALVGRDREQRLDEVARVAATQFAVAAGVPALDEARDRLVVVLQAELAAHALE